MLSAACLTSALFLLFPATASAEESGAESLADQIGVFGLTEILGQAYPLWLAIVALALYGGAIVALMAFLIARAAPSEKPAKKQESEDEICGSTSGCRSAGKSWIRAADFIMRAN